MVIMEKTPRFLDQECKVLSATQTYPPHAHTILLNGEAAVRFCIGYVDDVCPQQRLIT